MCSSSPVIYIATYSSLTMINIFQRLTRNLQMSHFIHALFVIKRVPFSIFVIERCPFVRYEVPFSWKMKNFLILRTSFTEFIKESFCRSLWDNFVDCAPQIKEVTCPTSPRCFMTPLHLVEPYLSLPSPPSDLFEVSKRDHRTCIQQREVDKEEG